jgi:hypothetical protein
VESVEKWDLENIFALQDPISAWGFKNNFVLQNPIKKKRRLIP